MDSMPSQGIIYLAISFLISALLTPVTIRVAHVRRWLDIPGGRKIHRAPIPRLGGVAVFIALWTAWFLFAALNPNRVPFEAREPILALFGASALMWVLGIYDDLRGANAWKKLIVQVIAAAIVVRAGLQVKLLFNPFTFQDLVIRDSLLSYAVSIGWIVFITNAINLMDGLDGLAGGICCITAASIYFISRELGSPHLPYLALSIAGACLGFLLYNFQPARIFLGDSGALTLGFLLACLSLMGATKRSTAIVMFGPPLILALPVADSVLAIIRRLMRGKTLTQSRGEDLDWSSASLIRRVKEIFQADQEHIHHGLVKLGLSHRRAVIILYMVTLVLGITAYRNSVGSHLYSTLATFALLGIALAWLRTRSKRH